MSNNFFNLWFYGIIGAIALFCAGYALWVIVIKLKFLSKPTPPITLPEQLPAKGFNVPLFDAYGGIKDVDSASVTQNFQKPKLILFDDHFVYKLIFRRSAKYSDLLEVTGKSQLLENFLQFTFNNRTLVLTVILNDSKLHRQVMDFLASKGVMVIE
jgi:hypothetical protein